MPVPHSWKLWHRHSCLCGFAILHSFLGSRFQRHAELMSYLNSGLLTLAGSDDQFWRMVMLWSE